MRKLIAAIVLTATSLLASAQTPDALCGQVLAADLAAVGASSKARGLVSGDASRIAIKDQPAGTPQALDGGTSVLCTDERGKPPNTPVVVVFTVAPGNVGAETWNQVIAAGAKDSGDKGMAGVALKAPGQAACFVTPAVKRQGGSVEGGSAQCFGFKGKVLIQMSVDDGVHKQEALASRVKQTVESVLSRL